MWTISRTPQIFACLASDVLPQSDVLHEMAARGNAIHEYLQRGIIQGYDVALETVPAEWRETCEAIDVSRLPASDPNAWCAEAALAYDAAMDTARSLGNGIGRHYEGVAATEIPGALDLLGLSDDGETCYVIDYKTGRKKQVAAKDHWQLKLGALAACRAFGAIRARVAIVQIAQNGKPWFDVADLDEMDIDSIALEVAERHRKLEAARAAYASGILPKTTEGDHCEHCPAFHACPAKTALARQLAIAPQELDVSATIETLTDEQAGIALERVWAAQSLLEKVEARLKERAAHKPIPLSNGKVYAQVEKMLEGLKGKETHATISGLYGLDVADQCVEMKASKTALDEALGAVAKERKAAGLRVTKKALIDEALAAIRAAGGAYTFARTEMAEVKPALPAHEDDVISA